MATSTADPSSQVARSRPRKGVLSRIFAALHESRMRQAQREIARHRHLFGDKPFSDDISHFGL